VPEERKSVLETTKPADALSRLSARQGGGRSTAIVVGVLALVGLIFLIATIITNTTRGTQDLRVPTVER
jgi:hypothetical protein